MILTGKASRTDKSAGGNGRRQASVASGMASGLSSIQRPGPARPPSARRVAVIVDGSSESVSALRRAASQARQRSATLDVICFLPDEADPRTVTLARVRLGEFTRRACPYGVGVPVRLRVEHGDLDIVLPVIQADVELLVTVTGPGTGADQDVPGPTAAHPPAAQAAPHAAAHQAATHWHLVPPRGAWLHTLLHASS